VDEVQPSAVTVHVMRSAQQAVDAAGSWPARGYCTVIVALLDLVYLPAASNAATISTWYPSAPRRGR
jgi:hypothetical protein